MTVLYYNIYLRYIDWEFYLPKLDIKILEYK